MEFDLAVDIGGTFTDVVLERAGRRTAIKVLTTYDDPADGVMQGIERVLTAAAAQPAQARVVLHGTTLATNALIQRSGAVTALVTTRGHRDALEMALENRFEQYDVNIDRPEPLVPRHLRLAVTERLDAGGHPLIALDESSVGALVPTLRARNVESVAIGFLHAYANSDHEMRAAAVLERELPGLSISLSSNVCPEIREYERLSTTCANAYVKPLMASYLESLAQKLKDRGLSCPVLMMTSGGGLTSLATAAEYPVRLVESGPAGGAILAAHIARSTGLESTLSFDMGGTTAKLCVIDQGRPLLSRSFEVDRSYRFKKGSGLPVRIPVIEMVEIGAGGGSLAKIDSVGRLQVGPGSAGSEPGPACYGRGGTQAAVTDADVVLGKIDPARFAGGRLPLDESLARQAIASAVGEPMGLSEETAAHAVSEVVNENMAAAARAHLSEWGKGTAGRTMIAFGGAAPLHACMLAHKLKIDRIVVPRDAGVGSAVGFLLAPISYEVVRSLYMTLENLDAQAISAAMEEMHHEALSVVGGIVTGGDLTVSRKAYMRYRGQGFEIGVPVDDQALSRDSLRQAFELSYRNIYGRVIPGVEVEILSWTLLLSGPMVASEPDQDEQTATGAKRLGRRKMFDPIAARMVPADCYLRDDLVPGVSLEGPALIMEEQTTVVVASGYSAHVTAAGHLLLIGS